MDETAMIGNSRSAPFRAVTLGERSFMSEGTGTRPMVIVGGGKTGGTAAATLRDEGFEGPVVLISREPGIPFGRPPLSKTYLRAEENLDGWYVRPAGWYEANDVDLRTDSVVAVGFIGCEVAASLTQLGVHVTAVFPGRNPLERVLGEQLGTLIGRIHRA